MTQPYKDYEFYFCKAQLTSLWRARSLDAISVAKRELAERRLEFKYAIEGKRRTEHSAVCNVNSASVLDTEANEEKFTKSDLSGTNSSIADSCHEELLSDNLSYYGNNYADYSVYPQDRL